ncbi:MAG TPA: nucleoside triphosphate pyrophosphohydrolase [Balneola sp.]|jgi:XTP/dITP diphosphohydrolase|nr:nucleoside triphosphate pyrophosphohydrolase [Bacteroidota bacterium]MAC06160.1 nucleoside triphosphate pyrophosphohydrolase [Balneola sp.]MAO78516.1 nucleoside triphosphate pyrophosphohydrolase [Balneola sp.]MBF64881.1 nucleoside triphosphate pyrophosphohydrolase [Balneola sp.]HAH50716.1 nucleoside triphosphate pyrophosphohydrolase [Balneola sp.]|tara:strand:- start:5588 stop:6352 length:765 start_codon:yes stop_codon:yes gene_type:complete
MQPSRKFEDLIELVSVLRKECPWDKKQTHYSIKDNLIEEAYEAIEALDNNDFDEFKKELGDLLLHVVFHSNIASETNTFDIGEVVYSLMEKLIRRHPHVFQNQTVSGEEEVAVNWENIKLKEGKKSTLDGLPAHLPALIKAQRMQEKAANVGFDWPEWKLAWEKLDEELGEFKETLEKNDINASSDEFGDVLFSMVNVARYFNLVAEDSLRQTNKKFEFRFRFIESELKKTGKSLNDASLEEMDQLWEKAKLIN